jgi:alginate O-acetyltransferase complex protein AlgJ
MEKVRKIYTIIISLVFVCWISFAFINDLTGFSKRQAMSSTENRNLAQKPGFDPALLDPYPKAYEDYFNDHFPFRQQLIGLDNHINFYLFKNSPLPDQVILGSNGWLYLRMIESKIYRGEFTLTGKQVDDIVLLLHRRNAEYRAKGIRYYVVIAPMKQEIYPEFLPASELRARGGTLTDRILEAIGRDTTIPLVNLRPAMLDAKKYGEIYRRTDNHWNYLGGYYAYLAICNRMKKDMPELKVVSRDDFIFRYKEIGGGTLANMIGLPDELKEIEPQPIFPKSTVKYGAPKYSPPPDLHAAPDYVINKINGDTTLPRAVVIRDSFTGSMIPYLDETFSRTCYLFDQWLYGANMEVIDGEHPDIVLNIIFEPYLSHLIKVF